MGASVQESHRAIVGTGCAWLWGHVLGSVTEGAGMAPAGLQVRPECPTPLVGLCTLVKGSGLEACGPSVPGTGGQCGREVTVLSLSPTY